MITDAYNKRNEAKELLKRARVLLEESIDSNTEGSKHWTKEHKMNTVDAVCTLIKLQLNI